MLEQRMVTFVAVAEKGSFSAASEHLHISQPAISVQIQNLENYYKVKLFERERGGVKLTPPGEVLYSYALKICKLSREAEREIKALVELEETKLALAASTTIGQYILPPVVAEFKKSYVGPKIVLYVGINDDVVAKVLNKDVPLGFIAGFCSNNRLATKVLFEDELVLVVSCRHPWSTKKRVSSDEVIGGGKLILREPGSGCREVIEKEFQRNGLHLEQTKIFLELGSFEAIKTAVEANIGYAILPGWAVEKEVCLGSIIKMRIEGMQFLRKILAISNNFEDLPDIYKKFLIFAQKKLPPNN